MAFADGWQKVEARAFVELVSLLGHVLTPKVPVGIHILYHENHAISDSMYKTKMWRVDFRLRPRG
jgi:hypothetical protein